MPSTLRKVLVIALSVVVLLAAASVVESETTQSILIDENETATALLGVGDIRPSEGDARTYDGTTVCVDSSDCEKASMAPPYAIGIIPP